VRLARDLRAHRARHGDHDAYAVGLEFEPEGAAVRDHGALGGAVHGPEHVGRDGREGGDVDDEAAGGDELVREGGTHGHDAEDVGFEGLAHVVEVDVRGWVGVGAAAGRGLGLARRGGRGGIRVVDEDVELAAGDFRDGGVAGLDAVGLGDVEGDGAHAHVGHLREDRGVAGGRDDVQAWRQ